MGNFNVVNFLTQLVEKKVSDIHLHVGEPPICRKDGIILKTNLPVISLEDMQEIVSILKPENVDFEKASNLDFLFEIPNVSRFRVNYALSLQKPMFVLRVIPYDIPSFEDMNISQNIKLFSDYASGIVFITGPTGCGKSTTLACLLDYINQSKNRHIVTIEDPIEYLYKNEKSIFSQRQVGVDTPDYASGVKYSLRQDPDIILVGEIRDRATASEALKAADTGHLVFATLHTTDAVQTIMRVINLFEPYERPYVKQQLADNLVGTIAQKLIRKVDKTGRIPAFEILVATSTIKDYILKDELEQIYELIKIGKFNDMITMNMYLHDLVKHKAITSEAALSASENKLELQQMLKGAFHGARI